jgi:glycosyltransferase involved in cell wall biosynthesis
MNGILVGSDAEMAERNVRVRIAHKIDGHTGFHGFVLSASVAGYAIEACDARHLLLGLESGRSPHDWSHSGEFIEGELSCVTHSCRWPVIGARGWIVDLDDVALPLVAGRAHQSAAFRAEFEAPWTSQFMAKLRVRVENMLFGYMHPSCVGILFWGHVETAFSSARNLFARLGLVQEGERFLEKITVVRPTARACSADVVERKWTHRRPLKVVFCGRDHESKNGTMALRIMQRLRREFANADFTYIGSIPREMLRKHAAGVAHHAMLPRESVLKVFEQSHVLFHPSQYESVGMVLLEACAAGMAVVSARGEGMDYADEIFRNGGALLVDRARPSVDEEREYEQYLRTLLTNDGFAAQLGMRNHQTLSQGYFACASLLRILGQSYLLAASSSSPPLALADLPHASTAVPFESQEIAQDEAAVRRRSGDGASRFHLVAP